MSKRAQRRSVGALLTSIAALCLLSTVALADYIETSAEGKLFNDIYSYSFVISETTPSSDVFKAELKNTSPSTSGDANIDAMWFNVNPDLTLGADFTITNITPDWTFSTPNGNAIAFDYEGSADNTAQQTNRLEPGESLTFDFTFLTAGKTKIDNSGILGDGIGTDTLFDVWLQALGADGGGAGGGTDSGQIAVSFQTLGSTGQDSDLLASNWTHKTNPPTPPSGDAPAPGTLFLLAGPLLGLAAWRRRKPSRRHVK